jgi:putative radical SAM enzyme (TIGR03279 family)
MEKNLIIDVLDGSISQELGVEKGDYLVGINGVEVSDCIEYRFLETNNYIELEIEKKSGEVWLLEIEKEMDETLGIVYENSLMDEVKTCSNKCVFCFIDQLPKGMRKSLYLKDDDSRLSFLLGNFLTMTNMKEEELDKIIEYGISPIKISVHSTNPETRKRLLKNKFAGNILEIIKRFEGTSITIDCQIVLVPEINDGLDLKNTIEDLADCYPTVRSVAIVPVGLTKYRDGLEEIRGFTEKESRENIDMVEKYQKRYLKERDTRFVYLSDEFYINGNVELPLYDSYEEFTLIENGVGMVRQFEWEVDNALEEIHVDKHNTVGKKIFLATGILAYELMESTAVKVCGKIGNLTVEVLKIENEFFGEAVTVSGLVTGTDIIKQLKGRVNGTLLIPKDMLKSDEDIFLDDFKLSEVEEELGVRIIPVDVNGYSLINEIIGECKNE